MKVSVITITMDTSLSLSNTLNQLSNKYHSFISEAVNEAKASPCNYKVGAVIVYKNQIIARAHNENNRTRILGRWFDTSLHAEMNVAQRLINGLVRPQQQRYRFSSREKVKGRLL